MDKLFRLIIQLPLLGQKCTQLSTNKSDGRRGDWEKVRRGEWEMGRRGE